MSYHPHFPKKPLLAPLIFIVSGSAPVAGTPELEHEE